MDAKKILLYTFKNTYIMVIYIGKGGVQYG